MSKECPNCGYDLDKHLTRSDKQKLKEKVRIEERQKKYPDTCFCDGKNYDTDLIVEDDIFIDVSHPLCYPRTEREGPYNKRRCDHCKKLYVDNPPILCG